MVAAMGPKAAAEAALESVTAAQARKEKAAAAAVAATELAEKDGSTSPLLRPPPPSPDNAAGVRQRAERHFFFSEHADGERRGPVVDPKVSKGTSYRDLSDATLRLDLALGVRRRRGPKRR